MNIAPHLKDIACSVFNTHEPVGYEIHSKINEMKKYFGPTINLSGELTSTTLFPPKCTLESSFLRIIDDSLLAMSRQSSGLISNLIEHGS
jgi:uroporphyrinogen-III decarboxylase